MVEPLNPFLRAFAQSTIRGQCSPASFALLAPTYESLVDTYDRDSKSWYAEYVRTEEFIASHVIRIPLEQPPVLAKENGFTRSRPRQYYTVNGRVVIVKDSHAYAAKGFKFPNQSLIVADGLWYQDGQKQDPWPILYINRPLLGNWTPRWNQIGTLNGRRGPRSVDDDSETNAPAPIYSKDFSLGESSPTSSRPKRDIKSFVELLDGFPQIERQLRPQLEKIFKDLREECDKAPPSSSTTLEAPASLKRTSTASSDVSTASSGLSRSISALSMRSGLGDQVPVLEITNEEERLRNAVDEAVRSTINAFQKLDKALLSHLTSSTNLEGHAIDVMMERFIMERVHGLYLFDKICHARSADELQVDLRKMRDVDPTQVGMETEQNRDATVDLCQRLAKGVREFKKTSSAKSPHQMLEILSDTLKCVTTPTPQQEQDGSHPGKAAEKSQSEKDVSTMSLNADMLVSLLLVVVIRSNVEHLKARLSYMRHFIFSEDVENGVNGYALSTLEVVISYISRESQSLIEASRRNRVLRKAIKEGNVDTVRQMLGGSLDEVDEESLVDWDSTSSAAETSEYRRRARSNGSVTKTQEPPKRNTRRISFEAESVTSWSAESAGTDSFHPNSLDERMEMHPALDGSHLARIRTVDGESLPRLAIDAQQKEVLAILLSETDYWRNPRNLLQDCDRSYQTLMMAALRTSETPIIKCLMDKLQSRSIDKAARKAYWAYQDVNKRSVGHYLYEYRPLILDLGHEIDWRQRDSVGRTPLVAICRSYDSLGYRQMVGDAITAATIAQGDDRPLRLEDHVDNKGNSLLHLLASAQVVRKVLAECSCDINCLNAKQWTPLIAAAKYGRLDVIRVLFADSRLNPFFKDASGLMAVEQAKSEVVRSLIDDLTLLRLPPSPDGRMTGVVRVATDRSGSTTVLLKHTVQPPSASSVTICSCWRTLEDFRHLAACLASESPASWIPDIRARPVHSPATIACRSWVREEVTRWINTILSHPAFSQHELVWEFFVLPELDWTVLSERSKRKAEIRAESIRDEYEPVEEPAEVQQVIQASQWHVGEVERGLSGVCRRSQAVEEAGTDMRLTAHHLAISVSTLLTHSPLPTPDSPPPNPETVQSHISALQTAANLLAPPEASPQHLFSADMAALASAATALSTALGRIPALVASSAAVIAAADRHIASSRRPDRLVPRGFLAETRARIRKDAERKAEVEWERAENLGREIAASRDVVVPEMAAQEEWRKREVKEALRRLARRSLEVERGRLRRMEGLVRGLKKG